MRLHLRSEKTRCDLTCTLWKAFVIAVAIVFCAVPATADQSLATSIRGNGAPITINSCGAMLTDTSVGNVNYYLNDAVKFTNSSNQTVVAVRFLFELLDAFGQSLRRVSGDVTGEFAPGVLIEPHYSFTGERWDKNVWTTINIDPNVAEVRCSVELVRFDDGTVWNAATVATTQAHNAHKVDAGTAWTLCETAFKNDLWDQVTEQCPASAQTSHDLGSSYGLLAAAQAWERTAIGYARSHDPKMYMASKRLALDALNECLASEPDVVTKAAADKLKGELTASSFSYSVLSP